MRRIILITLLFVAALPATSQAVGLFQYTWEAVVNQLGLARGPIPKIDPRWASAPCTTGIDPHKRVVFYPAPQLQAEGF